MMFIVITQSHAQPSKEEKPKYDTIKLEASTFQKLQAIEEQWKNLNDTKWVQQWVEQQKTILAARHGSILETVAESAKKEFTQNCIYSNGKIFVPQTSKPKN